MSPPMHFGPYVAENELCRHVTGFVQMGHRWLDDIKAVTNCTLTELCGLARDRDAWRKMVMGITRSRTRLDGTRSQGKNKINIA